MSAPHHLIIPDRPVAPRYSPTALVGNIPQAKRAAHIKKYKLRQFNKYGDKLEEHRRKIRGFKGRSEVAMAKPRINGKYVKKEVY